MNDDLGLLRQSLHELSEQGGDADIHARVLIASRKLGRRRRALALGGVAAAVVAVTVPLALAGPFHRAAPAPPPLPAAPSVTTSPSPATVTRTRSTAAIESHCPVGASTLLAVRKRNPEIDAAILATGSFSDIDCYQGYALARSHPVTPGDAAWMVFRYNAGVWSPVGAGTAGYCDGVVPDGIRSHLENCH